VYCTRRASGERRRERGGTPLTPRVEEGDEVAPLLLVKVEKDENERDLRRPPVASRNDRCRSDFDEDDEVEVEGEVDDDDEVEVEVEDGVAAAAAVELEAEVSAEGATVVSGLGEGAGREEAAGLI
jgi:hypothetical protein